MRLGGAGSHMVLKAGYEVEMFPIELKVIQRVKQGKDMSWFGLLYVFKRPL